MKDKYKTDNPDENGGNPRSRNKRARRMSIGEAAGTAVHQRGTRRGSISDIGRGARRGSISDIAPRVRKRSSISNIDTLREPAGSTLPRRRRSSIAESADALKTLKKDIKKEGAITIRSIVNLPSGSLPQKDSDSIDNDSTIQTNVQSLEFAMSAAGISPPPPALAVSRKRNDGGNATHGSSMKQKRTSIAMARAVAIATSASSSAKLPKKKASVMNYSHQSSVKNCLEAVKLFGQVVFTVFWP
jgi:hypothetical protein